LASDQTPAGTDGEKTAGPLAKRGKRSQTVSLVLLAGAGAAALGLGRIDLSQREEDVLIYADAEACAAAGVRSEEDCRRDHARAVATYQGAAPRYASESDCERHHGAGHCLSGGRVPTLLAGQAQPRMAAFLIGRRPEQGIEPQPLFEHEPKAERHGSAGYCTGSGARIVTSSGGRASTARVASSAVHKASFGGFGATGRSFSSGSSSHGSASG